MLFALVAAAAVIPGAYAQQNPYREDGWAKLPDGRKWGRSVVSAITQTPASGRFALVTVPPRSLAPTGAPDAALCEAPGGTWHAVNSRETPATARYEDLVVVMFSLLER
jgi:hypothetical protein